MYEINPVLFPGVVNLFPNLEPTQEHILLVARKMPHDRVLNHHRSCSILQRTLMIEAGHLLDPFSLFFAN